ncbi:hypothetical protein HDZ31DRAFT_47626 [Schizophyllum fasciatum]
MLADFLSFLVQFLIIAFLPFARAEICSGGGCYETHRPSVPAIVAIVLAIVAVGSLVGWSVARCARRRSRSNSQKGSYAFVSHGPGYATTAFTKPVYGHGQGGGPDSDRC